ncbi:MAG: penicillin-binding protein 1C, partial [Candidatus Eremiobacteraeota bacterium]|nr:penicillin-binding protein 1C [Candidatus Eremiobacteraeota bacterium]
VLASDSDHAAWVPLDRIAPSFLDAIVAAEDARFRSHGAIDALALVRATNEYAVYGRARSGGSTIAMQVARGLWNAPSSLRGKLRQIIGAERLAIRSSPDALLETYVNRVPMGGNRYGIEAAARSYFGVGADDLDLAQSALLAAIPNDPARLSPYAHWNELRTRQRYVLARMLATGAIDAAQARSAAAEELHVLPPDGGLLAAQHALFYLYPRVPVSATIVRTTIDAPLQRFVQAQTEQVVQALAGRHVTDAAALVIENATGDVLAYVGSPDYFADDALGRNDGVQALRQPGSSLKPFTYDLALERDAIAPNTILADVPTTYAIPGGRLYQPADYSTRFSGPVRVRYALANSLNVPAVRVLSTLGVDPLLARLRGLGFAHLDKLASYYGLGLTLGSGEVSLWELAHAYATMARDGAAIPLRLQADAPIAQNTNIGDPATWRLVTDMLADPQARTKSFGLHSILELPFPAAVKTGTSSDFRDTWTVGFSRDYTVGVWVGNFDGSAMRDVSGVTGAGPLWNRIMLHLHDDRDPGPFAVPQGFVRRPICATTGHKPDAGCAAIVTEWLRPKDLAAWDAPAGTLGDEYDLWLVGQDVAGGALHIVSPREGDTFALDPAPNAVARASERIELHAIGKAKVTWRVGGAAIPLDSQGHAFWTLRLGTWSIEASDGATRARVTIRVVRPPHGSNPGFTLSK